jgi:hypothetical protein
MMKRSSVAKAEKFLVAFGTGRALTQAQTQWVTLMRSRNKLVESELKRSITAHASTAVWRQPVLSGLTVKQTRKKAAGRKVAVSKLSAGNVQVQEGIPLTPAPVVNWLYQACADVVMFLNRCLGGVG